MAVIQRSVVAHGTLGGSGPRARVAVVPRRRGAVRRAYVTAASTMMHRSSERSLLMWKRRGVFEDAMCEDRRLRVGQRTCGSSHNVLRAVAPRPRRGVARRHVHAASVRRRASCWRIRPRNSQSDAPPRQDRRQDYTVLLPKGLTLTHTATQPDTSPPLCASRAAPASRVQRAPRARQLSRRGGAQGPAVRASPLVNLWHTDRRLGTRRGRLSPPGRLGSQRGWCPNMCPKHTSRVPQQYPWLNYCKPWLNCCSTPNGIVEHEQHSDEGTGTEPQGTPVDHPR